MSFLNNMKKVSILRQGARYAAPFVFSIFDNLCFGSFCLLWLYLLWILVVYSIGIREHRGSDAPYLVCAPWARSNG